MRLRTTEATIIKQTVRKFFGNEAKVFLFGSRTDNSKKGGDIDLYIETAVKENLFQKKVHLIQKLYEQLGEQKIDVVVNNFTNSLPIHKVARNEGILL
ncbi:MAG TPA: nucleotidyltransferase domain-containing protein [Flavobacteriaceae bacterium]|nr:nucleotidyltransferase domain-containing protein [Flavobacteriaceae bacterium]